MNRLNEVKRCLAAVLFAVVFVAAPAAAQDLTARQLAAFVQARASEYEAEASEREARTAEEAAKLARAEREATKQTRKERRQAEEVLFEEAQVRRQEAEASFLEAQASEGENFQFLDEYGNEIFWQDHPELPDRLAFIWVRENAAVIFATPVSEAWREAAYDWREAEKAWAAVEAQAAAAHEATFRGISRIPARYVLVGLILAGSLIYEAVR